jgi:hypothetical protein
MSSLPAVGLYKADGRNMVLALRVGEWRSPSQLILITAVANPSVIPLLVSRILISVPYGSTRPLRANSCVKGSLQMAGVGCQPSDCVARPAAFPWRSRVGFAASREHECGS